jgi:hypothetical protein
VTNTFSQLGAGLTIGSASVEAIHVLPSGQAVIGGQLAGVAGGNGVLLFDPVANTLSPLGGPTAGPTGIVHALTSVSGGGQTRLFVGGSFNGTFTPTGTLPTNNIARFDFPAGTWRRVGPGTHPNGDGVNGAVFGLHTVGTTILVGGSFSAAFGPNLGPGLPVANVAQVVSGPITSTWGQLGAGLSHSGLGVQASVSSFATHPFLGLVAGGQFNNSGGTTTNLIARFDGTNWQPIDTGLTGGAIAVVDTISALPGGGILCGGAFTGAPGVSATNIATRVVCPALSPSYGAGCASSAGVLTLTPNNRPIVGSTFFATCTNVPNSALAIGAIGFLQTSVPIASVGLPSGPRVPAVDQRRQHHAAAADVQLRTDVAADPGEPGPAGAEPVPPGRHAGLRREREHRRRGRLERAGHHRRRDLIAGGSLRSSEARPERIDARGAASRSRRRGGQPSPPAHCGGEAARRHRRRTAPEGPGARAGAAAVSATHGFQAPLDTVFPAVTCTVQASFLTGLQPSGHGAVGNGWYFRDLAQVMLWRQSNQLVQGEKLYESASAAPRHAHREAVLVVEHVRAARRVVGDAAAEYHANGLKKPGLYSEPPQLQAELQQELGPFPLFDFWGPKAGIKSTQWITSSALA